MQDLSPAEESAQRELSLTVKELRFEFVRVPAGQFKMGSDLDPAKKAAHVSTGPVHQVEITRPFQIGKYEVTMEQWDALMERNPSKRKDAFAREAKRLQEIDPSFSDSWVRHWLDRSKSENIPVDSVTWEEVQEFISRLNLEDSSHRYRLPTEAEWEYACRAGGPQDFSGTINEIAHWSGNAGNEWQLNPERLVGPKMPLPVGSKRVNAWGIHDMQGNVWEWVQDWYGPHSKAAQVDPAGPSEAGAEVFEYRGVKTPGKVFKGGSWLSWGFMEAELRPGYRDRRPPNFRHTDLGFRLVRTPR